MTEQDSVQRFLFSDGNVRGELVHLTESYQTIMTQHRYPKPIRELLGELLLSSVLLMSTLKMEGELTIQLQSDGPVNLLVAKCNHHFDIRGLAQWDEAKESEIIHSFTDARLVITVAPDKDTSYYQSIVPIFGGVSQAMEHYFGRSEQLETRVWLSTNEDHVGGMLLQLMPGLHPTQETEFWNHAVILASTIKSDELLNLENQQILYRLFAEEDIQLYEKKTVQFKCRCTLARMQQAILTLGKAEAEEILNTNPYVVVTCEYCNNEYSFDKVDVAEIFAKRDQFK